MLRKSVETRDWVNTIEPRNVRAVMKRVVEDTTSIDVQVQFVICWCHHLIPVLYLSSPCVERGSSEKSVRHHRSVCSMKKVWGKHTAVTPAKGLSLSTAAPGSKHAMQPATLPGQEMVVSYQLWSLWYKLPDTSSDIFFLSPWSAPMDTNLLSNIHKLFSERIDIFSSVEFNKVCSSNY